MSHATVLRGNAPKGRSLGFTLVELMIAIVLLSVVLGAIYAMSRATLVHSQLQNAQLTAYEEARSALQRMVTEARQARSSTFTGPTLPAAQIAFRVPGDADGNGTPLDMGGYLESTGTIAYVRDTGDLNGDGITITQLVRVVQPDGGGDPLVTVLTNDLMLNEDANGDGMLNPGEDTNGSRALERGIWFEWAGSLLRITVDCQKTVGDGGRVWTTLSTDVRPRN